jgi:hypothetical protein
MPGSGKWREGVSIIIQANKKRSCWVPGSCRSQGPNPMPSSGVGSNEGGGCLTVCKKRHLPTILKHLGAMCTTTGQPCVANCDLQAGLKTPHRSFGRGSTCLLAFVMPEVLAGRIAGAELGGASGEFSRKAGIHPGKQVSFCRKPDCGFCPSRVGLHRSQLCSCELLLASRVSWRAGVT